MNRMYRQPIIAVDVDGVLADLDTEWLRRYCLESGDNLTPDKLTSWDIDEQVKPGWRNRLYEILNDPLIYSSVKPYPGALEAVQELRKLGRVIFVTSTPAAHLESKFRWLVTHGFLEMKDIKDYFPVSDKHLVKADILLDDRVKNVEDFPQLAYLVQRHHNKPLMCSRYRLPGFGIDGAPGFLKAMIPGDNNPTFSLSL